MLVLAILLGVLYILRVLFSQSFWDSAWGCVDKVAPLWGSFGLTLPQAGSSWLHFGQLMVLRASGVSICQKGNLSAGPSGRRAHMLGFGGNSQFQLHALFASCVH